MNFPKECKIELAAADRGAGRDFLAAPYLNAEAGALVATDGHILAVVPVTIEPDDINGYLAPESLAAARKAAGRKGEPRIIAGAAATVPATGEQRPRPNAGERFPEYEKITRGAGGAFTLAINARLLADLAAAIGAVSGEVAIELDPSTPLHVMKVQSFHEKCRRGTGYIMPLRDGAKRPDILVGKDIKKLRADAAALDTIAALMSGAAWEPDTLDAIAAALRGAGRAIAEPVGATAAAA